MRKSGWRAVDDEAKKIDRVREDGEYGKRILGLTKDGEVYTCKWWQTVSDPDVSNFLSDGCYAVHLKAWQPLPDDDFDVEQVS